MTDEIRYFITVDRCNIGKRGIFCNNKGDCYKKESQHTYKEMADILGCFHIILNPKSEPFTENDIKKYNKWIPLQEYTNHYGIAIKKE